LLQSREKGAGRQEVSEVKTKVLLLLALALTIPMLMAPAIRAQPNADINGDGDVNILDIVMAGGQYMLTGAARNMTIVSKADFDGDGVITLLDLVTIIASWTG
jgi:Dockerin type I domain